MMMVISWEKELEKRSLKLVCGRVKQWLEALSAKKVEP